MLEELVKKNRSYRRFDESCAVSRDQLKALIGLARLCASAANLQPLRYILSCTPEKNALIFSCLKWAGYLKDWDGPPPGERPSAYIIMLCRGEANRNTYWDAGIAAQSILLGAVEKGLGGCMIASVDHDKLSQLIDIPDEYEIVLVIAVGRPVEEVVIDTVGDDGNIKYWRDENKVHHVPKRKLADIIIAEI